MRGARAITTLLATGAALVAWAAERPQSACFADAERVCPEVKPADPGFLACLWRRRDQVSPSCRKDLDRVEKRVGEFQSDCGGDVLRLCSNVPRGEGRVLACLNRSAMLLSGGCAQAVAIALEQVDVLEKECKPELRAHCPGVPRDGGRRFLCLKAKERLLSDRCRGALHL